MVKGIGSFVQKLNNFLCKPWRDLESSERDRQSRLLSGVLLIIIGVGAVMVMQWQMIPSHTPQANIVTIIALVFLAFLYIANRAGFFRLASVAAVLAMTAAIFLASIPDQNNANVGMLYFIVVPILFSAIFFPLKLSILYGISAVGGMIVFELLYPNLPLDTVPTNTTMILAGLLILSTWYKDMIEKERQSELIESEGRFRTLVHHTPEAILLIDSEQDSVIEFNRQAVKFFPEMETIQCPFPVNDLRRYGNTFYSQFRRGINLSAKGEDTAKEIKILRDGERGITCDTQFIGIPKMEDRRVVVTLQDITERKERELKLYFLANHDSLTKLPNRNLLNERMEAAINRSTRTTRPFALLFMDLDNFKHINDVFGHPVGDHLLVFLAERFKQHLRGTDTVARLGGDEFAVLVEELDSPVSVIPVIRKLISITTNPVQLQNREISITTSIGVSIYPQDGEKPEELLKNADAALYFTKSSGKNNFTMYEHYMTREIANKLELAQDLRFALARNEFFIEYQPQVNIHSRRIIGVEALVRWNHPEKGRLLPGAFLPIAEEIGTVQEIGDWVLKTAANQLAEWNRRGINGIRMAVNVAASQLRHGHIIDMAEEVIENSGIRPGDLELELTENILFKDAEQTNILLVNLKRLGVRIAVDDFGAGYSTLQHLASFPLDVLKVDRSFTLKLNSEPNHAVIVQGIADMARKLGLTTVAEGVEDENNVRLYRKYGYQIIQGFYYSRPLEAEHCASLIKSGKFNNRITKT
ncbi:MAG: putative bifunctional diguanylate cyclase/phosphodiesterase [Spirochaetia bacterium]